MSAGLPEPGERPRRGDEFLVVPERAVIDTGAKKIVYVEREPGLFEGVEVELGPRQDEYYPVLKGLKAGDQVAAAGGFLIDAETRLNPAAASTYFGASGGPQSGGQPPAAAGAGSADKTRTVTADAERDAALSGEDLQNIDQLPEADRQLAKAQAICPVTGAALGSMGVPVKITLRGKPVFSAARLRRQGQQIRRNVEELQSRTVTAISVHELATDRTS